MTPSECIGDARLSETPYKYEVRHTVTDESSSNSHVGDRAVCI